MGGLIKYVTEPPTPDEVEGHVLTGISSTERGGLGYNAAGAINAPLLSGKGAVRASAYQTHDGGFMDNIALNHKDSDRSDIYGGRLDLLLAPSDSLTLRLTGVVQNIYRDGEPSADYTFAGAPLTSALEQTRKTAEPFNLRFRLASATVAYDAHSATLTSISSYQISRLDLAEDLSPGYVPLLGSLGRAYSAVGYAQAVDTDKFTQELRLASAGTRKLDWLVGGFYTHESSENHQNFLLRDLSGAPAPNDLYIFFVPSKYEEYALFGDLTWKFTAKFDLTGGIRYARNNQDFEQIGGGALVRSHAPSSSSTDATTYLANARYHFTNDAIAYLRYATGYRAGGPNFATIDATTGLPTGPDTFEPDSLKSYEAGLKAQFAEGRLGLDVAMYYIDWSNIQISVTRGGFAAIANAVGGAGVKGAELMFSARPVRDLAITTAFAYQRAYMKQADTNLGASDRQQLPDVPRFTAALNADYTLPLGTLRPSVGLTARYIDDRFASWDNSRARPQYDLPSYTQIDLRAGFTVNAIELQAYIRNISDERGQLSAYTWQGLPRPTIMPPRTYGVTATLRF
jgi:outer membrane receptor protein involved in Fe transport